MGKPLWPRIRPLAVCKTSPQTTWCHLISINNRYKSPTHSSRQPTISPCESITRTTNTPCESTVTSVVVTWFQRDQILNYDKWGIWFVHFSTPTTTHHLRKVNILMHHPVGRWASVTFFSTTFLFVASEWCGYIIKCLKSSSGLPNVQFWIFILEDMNILKLHFSYSHEWRVTTEDNGQSYLLDSWTRI